MEYSLLSTAPSAAKRQLVTDDSFLKFLHPQLQPVGDNNPMLPPQQHPSGQTRSHETTPASGRSEHRQNKTKLPPTAVRDKMRTLDTDRQALDSQDQPRDQIAKTRQCPAAQINTSKAASVADSSVSITSSARDIMAHVRFIEEENRRLEAQQRIQTNPITKQSELGSHTQAHPEHTHTDKSEVFSLVKSKSVSKAQPKQVPQAQPTPHITSKNQIPLPTKKDRAPSPTSSISSRHSTLSITSSHAKLKLEAVMMKNQNLKTQAQPSVQRSQTNHPLPELGPY